MTEHVAVPIPVFAAVLKILGQMPHDQVNPLIAELQKCQKVEDATPTENMSERALRP